MCARRSRPCVRRCAPRSRSRACCVSIRPVGRSGRWRLPQATAPAGATGAVTPPSAVELTNWADQTLRKRLENVRGVGSVTLVGGTRREINLYLGPALEALGITPTSGECGAQREPGPAHGRAALAGAGARGADRRAHAAPEDFGRIIVGRKNGAPIRLDQVATVSDGAQEIDSLALYNGQRTLLLTVQKAQDENTIQVVDGLGKAIAELQPQLPPGVRLVSIMDASRPIRVAVDNVRRTLFEGALLAC